MSICQASEQYLNKLRERYRKSTKKQRGRIRDEFVETTGYHRKHAIALLRGKRQHHNRQVQVPIRHPRQRIYTEEDRRAVLGLAELFDQIGSKRLRAAMDVELKTVYRQRYLRVSAACFKRLQRISPATMERLRHAERRLPGRRRGGTKPGTLLKSQIPIRTFADWDDKRPGFEEIDWVQHDGGNPRDSFACTLNVTDVCTGWTEMYAVPTKAQKHVFAALGHIRLRLSFPLLGLDSDNGAEFINDQLVRYCTTEKITFPRSRTGRKNDNPFVEQKNWSVVRRLVGYARYETLRQVNQLNALYAIARLYVNHFVPVQKLVSQVREGRKTRKVFDAYKTPHRRVLDSADVSEKAKRQLRTIHAALDVVRLKRQIDELLDDLMSSKQW
jgi:hypothetical protein